MSKNKIWELIAKKLSGEATEEELSELEHLLRGNPEMHYPIQTVADLWHHATPETEDAHQAFATHAARMKDLGMDIEPAPVYPIADLPGNSQKKYLLLSLAFIVLAIAGYYSFSLFSPKPAKTLAKAVPDKSEVSTKYGSRTYLRLPDGTQVWLNSGSKISYDKVYGINLREVVLSGEAYFDVIKNPAHPFVIHTSNINIKVLGTAFNVKSFPGEKNSETSLIRGSIEVTFKNQPSKKIILKPNEKLITANDEPVKQDTTSGVIQEPSPTATTKNTTGITKKEPQALVSHLTYEPHDNTVIETSWMENKLIFRSETFEDLAVKMERWYGVTIRFADEAIRPKRLNGIFENETIQQALKALQLITPFTYKIDNNEVVISSK